MDDESPPTLGIVKLEHALESLLIAYRDALRSVERLPKFGRYQIGEKSAIGSGREKPKRRFIVRSFVRMFVEGHIRAKIEVLSRLVQIQSVGALDPETKSAKTLKKLADHLEACSKTLGKGKAVGSFDRLFTSIRPVLPIAAAFVAGLIGTDYSKPEALGKSIGLGGLPDALKFAAVIALYAYMLYVPLAIECGFRVKRAIFGGGQTLESLFDLFPDVEIWHGLGTANIYQLENDVFHMLGASKPKEPPLDFIFTFTPYFVVAVTAALVISLVEKAIAHQLDSARDVSGTLFFVLVTIAMITGGVKNYRERQRAGNA